MGSEIGAARSVFCDSKRCIQMSAIRELKFRVLGSTITIGYRLSFVKTRIGTKDLGLKSREYEYWSRKTTLIGGELTRKPRSVKICLRSIK